jgi:2-polyprenyl-3-methyl-5-hydroxy-6-metoxy-1,4-benzoquinol methylase
MTAQLLTLAELRCPRTGQMLRQDSVGDALLGPEGDAYPMVRGIRQFVTTRSGDAQQALYETLSAQAPDASAEVAYLSQGSFDRAQASLSELLPTSVAGLRILDVGCGHGMMTRPWVGRNQVVGVDFSEALLHKAEMNGLEVYRADALSLPFAQDLFDCVVCINLLQIVSDPRALVTSLVRVTKPGGSIIVTAPSATSLFRRAFRMLLGAGLFRPAGIPTSTYPSLQRYDALLSLFAPLPVRLDAVVATYAPSRVVRRSDRLGGVASLLADSFTLRLSKAAS